jgi:MFS family permease
VLARALRGLVDGFASLILVAYLAELGFSPFAIGALVTATLLGSAALTLLVGLAGGRLAARAVLFAACGLMLGTGLGFATLTAYWPLLVVGFLGTLNPSEGDLSVFLPTEQALLAEAVPGPDRVSLFARYNLAGSLASALGSLAVGVPELVGDALGAGRADAFRAGFVVYAASALPIAWLYRGMTTLSGANPASAEARAPLRRSRSVVLRLTALFALDSFGGGFVVKSILALWLFARFGFSVQAAGTVFFVAALLAGLSQLVSAWLAGRIGLIPTMVYTHLPANAFLALAAFMPNATLAIACLLVRMALSSMDVPARVAYVMSVVPPEERAAAASVTNVPRSLAGGLSPALAGALLAVSSFGWPLVIGGGLKIVYDLLLLAQFRSVPAPHERPTPR